MCIMLTLFFFLLFLCLACPWLCLCRVTLFLWLNLPWHFASRLSAVVCLSGCCHIFALAISSFKVLQAFCLLFCCTVRSTLSWGVGLSGRCIDHRRVSLSLGFSVSVSSWCGFLPIGKCFLLETGKYMLCISLDIWRFAHCFVFWLWGSAGTAPIPFGYGLSGRY